jgi:hypothetical protein
MKIKTFESVRKQYPYTLSNNGELTRTIESLAQFYLTDEEYNKVKGLADAVKAKCDNLDEQKKLETQRLKLIIGKIKND